MKERTKVGVKVPASTANLGPGFDTIGMALNLYTWIEMGIAEERTMITLLGDQLDGVATDKSNLVYKVAQEVFAAAGVEHPELDITMYSDIPLTRGLGSSASAIVGGLVAANELIGRPLGDDDLFQMASALEKHPDNVGASLFGGMIVAFWDGEQAQYAQLQLDERIEVLVVIPEFHLETNKARAVLPEQVKLQDAVFNVSHCSLLVAALATGKLELIAHAMKDRLHQPYRSALIPGMDKVLEGAVQHGALGVALSGAGPTLLALVDRHKSVQEKNKLEHFLRDSFLQEQIAAETIWLNPCEGAQIVPLDVLKEEVKV